MPWSVIIIIFWMLAWWWYYDIWDVIFFSTLWNALWGLFSFYIWKKIWKKVLKEWFYFIKAKHFLKADYFFIKHWWKSILFWKIIPWIKENISFISWVLKVWIFKFIIYNTLGWLLWSLIFVWIWYVFSSSLSLAEMWGTRFWYIILITLLLFSLIYFTKYFFIRYWKEVLNLWKDLLFFLLKRFLSNKKIKNLIENNPKKIIFLKNRFNKNIFFWLPFTILFLLIIYVLTEYIWFTDAILDKELITQIDIRLSNFFYYFKDDKLISFFLFISYFWSVSVVFLITLITNLILFLKQKKNEIIWIISSVVISSIISTLSKIIIHRNRPELAIYNESSYSFPSFHATMSIALYWFIVRLLIRNIKKWKTRINYIFIWIFIAFSIWFSRLYLNVHYLSDVIAGWLLWFLWILFGITITWYLNNKYNKKTTYFSKNIINISIVFLTILWIWLLTFNYKNYYKNINFTENKNSNFIEINSVNSIFENNTNLKYTETITWRKTEPINFIFITKNKNDLIELFKNNWWKMADNIWTTSIKNIWKALLQIKDYKTAPVTPLYWNKEIQNYSFQKQNNENTIKKRHHIRIWKTNYKISNNYIFVWCWIYDDWIKWWITHKISPNIDKEREFILNSLKINNSKIIQLEKWFIWTNFSWDNFFTDWKAYLINIK